MVKERIQEVFDFTKSESPYRKANKGWINQDIFLDLNPSADRNQKANEAAKITLFWSPINSLLSNIFLIIIIGSIFVFTSVSFTKGRFDFNKFNIFSANEIVSFEENKALNIVNLEDMDSTNVTIEKNLEKKESDKQDKINLSDDDLNKVDEEITNKKADKLDTSIKESDTNKDIKILQNKKPRSNFI